MSLYTTRQEAAAGCKAEAAAATRYGNAAIEKAAEGKCNAAWRMADIARTAATCAMQAHEALWDLSGGQLTEEEFEAFEAAEIAVMKANKAAKAAAAAVQKMNEKE